MSTGVMINEPVFAFPIAFCNVYWQFDPATKPVYMFIEVQQPAGKLAVSSLAVSDVSISALPWESWFHGWVHTYTQETHCLLSATSVVIPYCDLSHTINHNNF